MRVNAAVLAIITFVCFPFFSNASQPRISISALENRIDHSSVTAIRQDRNGFLWIGTQQGLYRLDGTNITSFNSERTNKNWTIASGISDLDEDADGNLLASTINGGLLKWNRRLEKFESFTQFGNRSESHLTRVLVSRTGDIWLGSTSRLILYRPNSQIDEKHHIIQKNLDRLGRPHYLLEDESGNILVGSNLGLSSISGKSSIITTIDLHPSSFPKVFGVTALELDNIGNLYIGTNTGHLAVLDMKTKAILAQSFIGDGKTGYISEILFTKDGLFIGTEHGLFTSSSDLSSTIDLSDTGSGLSNKNITSLYKHNRQIWVGTYQGLNILSFPPFQLFDEKNSGISGDIVSIEEDSKKRLWIGTFDGLYILEKSNGPHVKYEEYFAQSTLIGKRVSSIARKRNQMWLGFYGEGIQVIDVSNGISRIPDIPRVSEFVVTKILASKQTKDVWIATYDHGLYRIESEETQRYSLGQQIPRAPITLLFESRSGDIFSSTLDKIFKYSAEEDKFHKLDFDFGLGDVTPTIFSFSENKKGDIWIGTKDNGLFFWSAHDQLQNRAKVQSVERTRGWDFSTIFSIQIDERENLWCSTHNGIVKLSQTGELLGKFTMSDGLQGSDFELGASYQSKDGYLYFGGPNGYNRFHPDDIVIDTSPSPMRLTGIDFPRRSGKKLIDVSDFTSLQLTHEDRFVTFEFSVLDFLAPDKNQYRYKLEGFDSDWIENGTRNTATYTNLPAGDYVFRAQGANSSGIWNRDGISLDVDVLPPPWLTWWALCFYATGLLIAIWSMHRVYRSYAINRNAVRMAREMRDAEDRADDQMQEQLEIQDEIVKSAYQHNLATLALVRGFVGKQNNNNSNGTFPPATEGSMKRIAVLAILEDCLFYHAGGPAADMKKFTEIALSELLKSAPVNPETVVTINEVPGTLIPASIASPLAIVIYELLENCMQHAFEQSSPANYIQVRLQPETNEALAGDCWKLTVADSGVGMSPGVLNLDAATSGLAIVRSIVKDMGGTIDISDANGSTVVVALPEVDTRENQAGNPL